MPLIEKRQVKVLGTAPTAQDAGFNVQPYDAVYLTISELIDLDQYSLEVYSVIDDNNPDTGDSDYDAATTWPIMDQMSRTKTSSTHLIVPTVGVGRLDVIIPAWVPSGGSPSLVIRARGLKE